MRGQVPRVPRVLQVPQVPQVPRVRTSLVVALAAMLLLRALAASPVAVQRPDSAARQKASRIISLVPALTEMVFAIGAGSAVVAVSSYDDYPPEVRSLPKVGALIDPDVERIIKLRPDLVLLYGSQADLMTQLSRASIRYFEYRHGGLAEVTSTIRALGDRSLFDAVRRHRAEARSPPEPHGR